MRKFFSHFLPVHSLPVGECGQLQMQHQWCIFKKLLLPLGAPGAAPVYRTDSACTRSLHGHMLVANRACFTGRAVAGEAPTGSLLSFINPSACCWAWLSRDADFPVLCHEVCVVLSPFQLFWVIVMVS